MQQAQVRHAILVLAGIALAVCLDLSLNGYARLAFPDPKATSAPFWYAASRPVLSTLANIAPAFVVGWFARQSGFLLGALVGAGSSLAIQVLFRVEWSNFSISPFNWSLCFFLLLWAFTSAISSSMAGAAGELARTRLPSNYSLKRTAAGRLR